MNTLTVNLHLMMVSFYRPNEKRHKIIIEEDAFPSDIYAVESQIKHHGFSTESSLIKLKPKDRRLHVLVQRDIQKIIEKEGKKITYLLC